MSLRLNELTAALPKTSGDTVTHTITSVAPSQPPDEPAQEPDHDEPLPF